MGATMKQDLYRNDKTIDDYMNGELALDGNNSKIINMCLVNGTMGREDQLKLRELYPRLFDEVEKFLSSKNHGRIYIHEEVNKPDVINVFIHEKSNDSYGVYNLKKNGAKSLRALIRNNTIRNSNFVFIDTENHTHYRMIEDTIRWNFNWGYNIFNLKIEREFQQDE